MAWSIRSAQALVLYTRCTMRLYDPILEQTGLQVFRAKSVQDDVPRGWVVVAPRWVLQMCWQFRDQWSLPWMGNLIRHQKFDSRGLQNGNRQASILESLPYCWKRVPCIWLLERTILQLFCNDRLLCDVSRRSGNGSYERLLVHWVRKAPLNLLSFLGHWIWHRSFPKRRL